MNRYQFEDLISEYIENELSFSKRKEFESFLKDEPLKPGSFRNRKSSAPETNKINGTKNA